MCIGNATDFIEFNVQERLPGEYNLTIFADDEFGQSVAEIVPFFLSGMYNHVVVGSATQYVTNPYGMIKWE